MSGRRTLALLRGVIDQRVDTVINARQLCGVGSARHVEAVEALTMAVLDYIDADQLGRYPAEPDAEAEP